jgi:hypothetical protein
VSADTLAQIAEDTAALDTLLTELGGDVTDEQGVIVDQWFAELDKRRAEKVDGYAWRIKALREQADATKRLADELLSKTRSAMSRADWLLARMRHLEDQGETEVRGHIYRFAFQQNGGKAPVVIETDDPMQFPEDCRVTVVSLNKERIRERLEAGETLPAMIGERGRSLRIR